MADCSLVSESLNGAQNAGAGLARMRQLAEALEKRDLAPVSLQHLLGQLAE